MIKRKKLNAEFEKVEGEKGVQYVVYDDGDVELTWPEWEKGLEYPVITREQIRKLAEIVNLPPRGTTVDIYLHSSKEAMREEGKQEGLSDKQLELFMYACSEVKVTLSVNEEGEAEIIAVNDRQFKEEE